MFAPSGGWLTAVFFCLAGGSCRRLGCGPGLREPLATAQEAPPDVLHCSFTENLTRRRLYYL
jgi:hypothetical protein